MSVGNAAQVKPYVSLVGHVCRDNPKSYSNPEKAAMVKDYVKQNFWCCEPYIQNEDLLLDEYRPYPAFFAAGWFVVPSGQELKQALIVVHGDSMEEANKKLLNTAGKVDWS
jgi:hypothetical protein